jgi:hypothetical protein
MQITLDDAIKMYARACRSWYGTGASRRVKEKASSLAEQGDLEGQRVWNAVAAEIEQATAKAN